MISMDTKKRLIESAKKDKAGKDFIISVYGLIPVHEQDKKDFEEIGFLSLSEFIQSSAGLLLDSETFVKLAFAYWAYRVQACEVIKYLVIDERWGDLLNHVPADYQVDCGARLKTKSDNDRVACDNVTSSKRGNSKSYTLKRLARDAENDAKVAEVYNQVKKGSLSPNKAAISLGWRIPTITVRKDPDSAARSLKKLFNEQEIMELIRQLE